MTTLLAAQVEATRASASWAAAQAGTPDTFSLSAVKVLLVLAFGIAIFAASLALRGLLPLLPLSRAQRDRLTRFGPFVELVVWALFLTAAITWLLEGQQTGTLIALTIGGVAVVTAGWFAIRDYLTGVILRVERIAQVGDWVRLGELHGRITELGTRVAQLTTSDGDTVVVPYSRLTREALMRSPRGTGAAAHTFVVQAPPTRPPGEVARALRAAVLLCHWAAPGHSPTVRHVGGHAFEVTIQPLSDERSIEVEEAVRQAAQAAPL
jgi:small-conductance mechanosensitive channel